MTQRVTVDISTYPPWLVRRSDSEEPVGYFSAQRKVLKIAAGVVALVGVMSSLYDGLRSDSPLSVSPAEAAESTHRAPPERVPLRLPVVGVAQGTVAGPVAPPTAPRQPALSMIDDFSGFWGG